MKMHIKKEICARLRTRLTLILMLLTALPGMQVIAQTYCTPEYNYPGYSCTYGYGRIYSFNLSGVNGDDLHDVPPCSPDYKDRTAAVPALDLAAGSTFYGSIGINYYYVHYNIWIDFNDDGTFDASERLAVGAYPNYSYVSGYLGATYAYNTIFPVTLSVPSTAAAGTHRMRVRAAYLATPTSPLIDPCAKTNGSYNHNYGSAVDYMVNITSDVACGPVFTALAGNQSVCPGSNTSFSVTASGATTYQWQVNSGSGFSNLTNTVKYSGVSTNTLTITDVAFNMTTYQYRCMVSDGSCISASNNALLWVKEIQITEQPVDKTALLGGNNTFSVSTTSYYNIANSFQWQVNTGSGFTNITNGSNYSGVTNSTLTVNNPTLAMSGYVYRCKITNGTCSVISEEAALTVMEGFVPEYKYDKIYSLLGPPLGSGKHTSQSLYTPGDFGSASAGMIKTIYIRSGSNTSEAAVFSNLKIDIGSTSLTSIATWQTGLTNVFTASTCTIPATLVNEWIPIELQTPIYFDPSRSLIIQIGQTGLTGAGIMVRGGNTHVNTAYTGLRTLYKVIGSAPTYSASYLANIGLEIAPCLEINSKPANVTVNTDLNDCSASSVSLGSPTATSACGTVVITNNAPAVFPKGETVVTWTVTDGIFTSTFNQTVTVVDQRAPVFTSCPSNITVAAPAGKCSAVVNYSKPTATDNCGLCSVPETITGYTKFGTFGGHTYFTSDFGGGWEYFDSVAKALGGHLVTLGSAEEETFLRSHIIYWSGLTDKATEGTFVWSNGEPVTYTNWCSSEPNNLNNEDYLIFNWGQDRCWNDAMATSDEEVRAVIEFECNPFNMTLVEGPDSGSTFPEGTTTVKYKTTDVSGNFSYCTFTVTVNSTLSSSISVTPSNNTYTGGVPTNIYLGYGPQSATLNASATGGTGFNYSWSPAAGLSCTNCQDPLFTPTAEGYHTYTVTATNSEGCETKSTVTFCVLDIKAPNGNNKVYLCHDGQTLSISSNAVPAHLGNHDDDKLGACEQSCGSGNKTSVAWEEIAHDEEGKHLQVANVYPNPNNGQFTVDLPESFENAEVTIRDMNGRTIRNTMATDRSLQFDISGFAKGIYIVSVQAGEEIFRTKLSVQ
jgi:hypothetical protein